MNVWCLFPSSTSYSEENIGNMHAVECCMRFIGKRFLSLIDKVLRCIAKTSAAFSGQRRRQLGYLKAASFLLKCAGCCVQYLWISNDWLVFFWSSRQFMQIGFSLHICKRNGMRYITSWYRRLLGSEILHQQQKVEEMLLFFSFLYLTGRCLQGAFTSQP